MDQRLKLQAILEECLGTDQVFFQPPPNISLKYPSIIYKRDQVDAKFADNSLYRNLKRYQVIVIDRDPDSEIPDKIAMLPYSVFNRFYTADNLNHDVFNLFF